MGNPIPPRASAIDALCCFAVTILLLAPGCSSHPTPLSPITTSITTQTNTPEPAVDPLPPTASQPPAPFPGKGWQPMFDGRTLAGWKETDFAGHGKVRCESGAIVFNMGDPFTGLNYTNAFPTNDYEISFDAMRVAGSDFFCGLTVPVGASCCSLIVGGWGGTLVGISSLDGMDASENETTKFRTFKTGQWYRIRLRITSKKIEAWIDDDDVVNVAIADRRISVRPGEIEMSEPIGLASWQTTAAFREIKLRRIAPGG